MEPIVTPEEMARIDAAAPEPVQVLIDRAGAAVARAAIDLLGGAYGMRVVVIAGKGNNGADGRACAARLRARGVRCTVIDAGSAPDVLPPADLVIDAAYGTGFRGAYDAPGLHEPSTPVLAVDIPSGVSGTTGEVGGRVLAAARTVTFAARKPGLLLGEGPTLAGAVEVADIGLDVGDARAALVTATDVASWLPARRRAAHKWQSAAWIVAGSSGMTGAAQLVASAALRSGAGYVRLSVPGEGHELDRPVEAVVVPVPADGWADAVVGDLDRFSVIGVGPGLGLGAAVDQQVRRLVSGAVVPTVVDGDGLRALGSEAEATIAARPPGAAPVILTPHDGEFEALAGRAPDADRFEAVRALACSVGAVVLLKGPTTLVATPSGEVLASTSGDARLATAGSGDVLTGLIVGLLAQGLPAHPAAIAAAYLHGRAGDLAWARGLVAGDLVDHLPAAFHDVAGG